MPSLVDIIGNTEKFLGIDSLPILPPSSSARLCHETMVQRGVRGLIIEEAGTPLYLISSGFLHQFIRAVAKRGLPFGGYLPPSDDAAFKIVALLPVWWCILVSQTQPDYLRLEEQGDEDPELPLPVVKLPEQEDPYANCEIDTETSTVYQVTQISHGWYVTGNVNNLRADTISTPPPPKYLCNPARHGNNSWDSGKCSKAGCGNPIHI
jgi:hypothetical protein